MSNEVNPQGLQSMQAATPETTGVYTAQEVLGMGEVRYDPDMAKHVRRGMARRRLRKYVFRPITLAAAVGVVGVPVALVAVGAAPLTLAAAPVLALAALKSAGVAAASNLTEIGLFFGSRHARKKAYEKAVQLKEESQQYPVTTTTKIKPRFGFNREERSRIVEETHMEKYDNPSYLAALVRRVRLGSGDKKTPSVATAIDIGLTLGGAKAISAGFASAEAAAHAHVAVHGANAVHAGAGLAHAAHTAEAVHRGVHAVKTVHTLAAVSAGTHIVGGKLALGLLHAIPGALQVAALFKITEASIGGYQEWREKETALHEAERYAKVVLQNARRNPAFYKSRKASKS